MLGCRAETLVLMPTGAAIARQRTQSQHPGLIAEHKKSQQGDEMKPDPCVHKMISSLPEINRQAPWRRRPIARDSTKLY
jgi:hypothetical protein